MGGGTALAFTMASGVSPGSPAGATASDIVALSPGAASGPATDTVSAPGTAAPVTTLPRPDASLEPSDTTASPATAPATLPAVPAENPQRLVYGPAEQQFGELWLPSSPADASTLPVVVLIHGGFWYSTYGLDLMDDLARDLSGRGVAVWNIEYRRIGDPGGGWPGTFDDVAAAVDHLAALADVDRLDLADVTVIGHSAGGHLALWVGGRQRLQPGVPGASPAVVPRLVIGMGPVTNLRAAARDGLGSDAVLGLLGGSPAEVPARYDVATPVPVPGVGMIVVRGGEDDIVPARYTLPDPPGNTAVIDVPGENHFHLIDPRSNAWAAVLDALHLRVR